MQKIIKGYVAGVLSIILLLSVSMVAYAAVRTQSLSVTFNNIRLVVNGELIIPRDANGHVVEPFIYNGTTFLPVRALAEALGQDVRWDGETATVYVGQGEAPTLPTVPYVPAVVVPVEVMLFNQQHISVGDASGLRIEGNALSNTIQLWGQSVDGARLPDDGWMTSNYIVYSLGGTAARFMATLNPPGTRGRADITYRIYGDGRLLFESHAMTSNVLPVDIDVDVAGVAVLRIEVVLVTRTLVHPFEVLGRGTTHRGIENARIVQK